MERPEPLDPMNVYDGLPSARKLEFITSRVLPAYLAFESQCIQLADAYHRKIRLCHERFQSAHSIEEKKFYGEQAFRLFYSVYEEFKALQTGSCHLPHHLDIYRQFEHNRSKERYRYKTSFLSVCSIDGLQYELHDLKSRLVRNSDAIEDLQNKVDTFGHRYTEAYGAFIQSMADFAFKISGTRLEKPQDSLIEKGIFKCSISHEDARDTITFIPKRTARFTVAGMIENQVIEEYEGSHVRKIMKPSVRNRILDEEANTMRIENDAEESIQAIKEQYGKSASVPAAASIVCLPTAPEEYYLVIEVRVKYTTIGADDKMIKSSQQRTLRFIRCRYHHHAKDL